MNSQQKKVLLGFVSCLLVGLLVVAGIVLRKEPSRKTATQEAPSPLVEDDPGLGAATTLLLPDGENVEPSLQEESSAEKQSEKVAKPSSSGNANYFIRNESPRYRQDFDTPEAELSLDTPGKTIPLDSFFLKTPFFEGIGFGGKGHKMGNGKHEGQFRVACEFSHLNEDDPIVFPDQPGKSHLHFYFGNTNVDAFTKYDPSDPNSLTNKGGGTCSGLELNRTGYWIPAMLDGKGNFIKPKSIIVYYKSHNPEIVEDIPQGLKMITGNPLGGGSFSPSNRIFWACGRTGEAHTSPKKDHIHNCSGGTLNFTVQFPNCWDGESLDSSDHSSHMAWLENYSCPTSHPVHIPQVSILVYFEGAQNTDGWYLSSDHPGEKPGSSLHSDWWGGWNNGVAEFVGQKCISPGMSCSFGQTGSDVVLAPVQEDLGQELVDAGPHPLPEGVSEKYFKPLG